MAEKLIWSELRRVLAARADVSEKDANAFLTALNAQIIEALKRDKQIKINGLGTFKLQAVAPRKSVNVTTGEEIIIEGYNKVVFAPESSLKELVESTTVAGSQTVTRTTIYVESETIDPLKKLGAQAEEIVDLLSDLGQDVGGSKSKVQDEQPDEPEEPVVPEEPEEEPKEEPEIPEEPEQPVVPEEEQPEEKPEQPEEKEEPAQAPEPVSVTIVEQTVVNPVFIPEPASTPQPEEPKYEFKTETYMETNETFEEGIGKESHFLRNTLICILVLLLLLGAGAYFVRDELKGWIDTLTGKSNTEVVAQEQEEPNAAEFSDELAEDEFDAPEIESPAEEPAPVVTPKKEPKSPANPAARPTQSGKSSKINTYGKKNPTAEEVRAEFLAISSNFGEELPPIASYPDLLTIEPIAEGSRMTWLAKKYYGAKIYWPYIFDANRDHLPNPSLIEVGTPVRIPRLTAVQRDTTNAQTMANIERLRLEAEEASR